MSFCTGLTALLRTMLTSASIAAGLFHAPESWAETGVVGSMSSVSVMPVSIVETGQKMLGGSGITLHLRLRHDPNPFNPGEPFTGQHKFEADEYGRVSGKQLLQTAGAVLSKDMEVEVFRLLSPEVGVDPAIAIGAITVGDSASEFYNAYVATDDKGAFHLFVEAQVRQ